MYRNFRHEYLFNLLKDEQKLRDQRGIDFPELERKALHEEVNRQRSEIGKHPVPLSDVESVETYAMGHFDYSQKFTLYCTEMIEDAP